MSAKWVAWVSAVAILAGASSVAYAFAKEDKKGEAAPAAPATGKSVLDYTLKDIDGKEVKLGDEYAGTVLLIVNVASKCGYTKQYTDLQAIYEKYKDQGLVVLGMPCNDFGGQEPGTEQEIKAFCSSKYSVTFPMFSKLAVKGDTADPLYNYLTSPETNPASSGPIKWNFTKFLIGRDGNIVTRFESGVVPTSEECTKKIEEALAVKAPAGQ